MLTVAQTMQNIWNFMVGKSSVQETAPLAVIRGSWQHCFGTKPARIELCMAPPLPARSGPHPNKLLCLRMVH